MSLQPPERRLVTEATLADYISENPDVAQEVAGVVTDRDLVVATSVRRILVSGNPDTPLIDGDLLLVAADNGRTYFDDFTTYTVGEFPYAGWTLRWGNLSTWTIADVPDATGGKALANTSANVSLIGMDAVAGDPRADVEIAYKWRTPATGAVFRGVLRGGGEVVDSSTRTGYQGAHTNASEDRLSKYLNSSSSTTVAQQARTPALATNTWYITRFRAHGTHLQARTWPADTTEPTTWDIQGTDTDFTQPGYVGILNSGANVKHVDWVGVGTGPADAPLGD